MAKYKIIAPVEWVMGHLKYGHYEGELELTKDELQKIKENPNLLHKYDLKFIVDDYNIEYIGSIDANEIDLKEC